MTPLRQRLHQLVDSIPDQEVEQAWELLVTFYYDISMLAAIELSQNTLKPGDSLTYEEVIQVLYGEYGHRL
ncbi:MAG: hypothetical protein ACFBSC_20065 [Microcoleaceae cyanobacterium]